MVAQLVKNFTAFKVPYSQKPVRLNYFDLFKPVHVHAPSFKIVLTFKIKYFAYWNECGKR